MKRKKVLCVVVDDVELGVVVDNVELCVVVDDVELYKRYANNKGNINSNTVRAVRANV